MQAAPRVFQRSHAQGKSPFQDAQNPTQASAPPSSSRFKPAASSLPFPSSSRPAVMLRQSTMGPPPTPQLVQAQRNPAGNRIPRPTNQASVPPSSRQQIGTQDGQSTTQQTPASAAPQRFFSASRQPSALFAPPTRSSMATAVVPAVVGQRRPFVPLIPQDSRQPSGFG